MSLQGIFRGVERNKEDLIILGVCKKPGDKYTEKLEKYNKLLLLAGEKY